MAFIIRWKGHLAEGKIDTRPIIQLDVLPTALAAAGVQRQSQWRFDGVNLLPFLTGKETGRPHETLYWRLGEHMAIRKGDWKLVKTKEGPLKEAVPSTLTTYQVRNSTISQKISEKQRILRRHIRRRSGNWLLTGSDGTKNLRNRCGHPAEWDAGAAEER